MEKPQYADLPLDQLREPDGAHRIDIDPDELHRLADSMARNGLHQAVAARGPCDDGSWEIIWGHRRLLAARLLRWPTLHTRCYPKETDPTWARLDENNVRTDLTPLEEARQVAIVRERSGSDSATARYFQRSQTWVAARLELLRAPDDIQARVHTGELALGVALRLASIDDDAYRHNLTEEAIRTGATVSTAEIWKQHWLSEGPRLKANHAIVDGIMADRENWKYYVQCGTCGDDVDFTKTRQLRMCPECARVVLAMIDQAAAQAAGQQPT